MKQKKKPAVQLSSLLFFLLLYFLFSDTQTKKWKNKKYVQRIEGQEQKVVKGSEPFLGRTYTGYRLCPSRSHFGRLRTLANSYAARGRKARASSSLKKRRRRRSNREPEQICACNGNPFGQESRCLRRLRTGALASTCRNALLITKPVRRLRPPE